MLKSEVLIKKLHPDAIIPEYKHDGDAGFDFYSLEDYKIRPGELIKMKTGLAISFSDDYELQIRLRSGVATNVPLIIPNAPCTIDSNYRGEIIIPLRNIEQMEYQYNSLLGGLYSENSPIIIKKGDRIAQGILSPVIKAIFKEVDELPESNRGENGFGSTDRYLFPKGVYR